MTNSAAVLSEKLDPKKFRDPDVTASGEARAVVPFRAFETLWFNTGTLCNLTCRNCYIESSPTNDHLVYLAAAEVAEYLDELAGLREPGSCLPQIGFTGGEPFMNPEIMPMLAEALERGHRVLVLTNAMRPMRQHERALLDLKARHGDRLVLRVSLDHHTPALHELERGPRSWPRALDGLLWLSRHGFALAVAGRTCWREGEAQARAGYARLFAAHGVNIDARDPAALVLFPEMDADADVPEISGACWGKLNKTPDSVMCASSRMVIKRRGDARPVVVACTLLPYEAGFEMGRTLAESRGPVKLNHPHCARFCVLGGCSCSPAGTEA